LKSIPLLWSTLVRDESAQDLIEYALVAALVGLGAVASLKGLATSVSTVFTSVGTTLTNSL
jgi:pilus assembly protein Flp/PilA